RRNGLIDWRRQKVEAVEALKVLGSDIDPNARIADLSRTDKSIVAIARALSKEIDL
ncbi:MAG TPA: sugar ABC transporter ATP-binding protein, partial [Ktedonobacter sp.]|nr:sugar ABC transporter ATP-binding protein [Ktedonobacter sp.]